MEEAGSMGGELDLVAKVPITAALTFGYLGRFLFRSQ
jgi:hypothetical protein